MIKHYVVASDIRRSVFGKNFLVGTTGMVLVIILSSLESMMIVLQNGGVLSFGFHAQMIKDALSGEWVVLTLPIICTLPFATAFLDDIKSGFIRQYLYRAGNTGYIKGKLIACGLSGGLVLIIGIMLAYGIFAIVSLALEIAPEAGETILPDLAELFQKAAIMSVSGIFWALTGFTIAALTMNKYVAYTSPFILYYVLIILHERYFQDFYLFYPKEWLFPSELWVMGSLSVLLLLTGLSALVCIGFHLIAKRRLAHV